MQVLRIPTAVSAGGSWTNPANALPNDSGAYATNAAGTGWLEYTFPPLLELIPDSYDIAGLRLSLTAGLRPVGNPDLVIGVGEVAKLEAQFSVNGGASWVGTAKKTDDMGITQAMAVRILGDDDDLWGRSWLPQEINSGGLKVRVRRPTDVGENATQPRLLEGITLDVFANAEEIEQVSDRVYSLQRCVIGAETVAEGTRATSFKQLRGSKFTLQEVIDSEEVRTQGDLIPLDYIENNSWASGSYESVEKACYNDVGLWLASVVGLPTTQLLATGVYQHTFLLAIRSRAARRTYSMQWGDPAGNGCEEVLKGLAQSFNMEFGEKKVSRFTGAILAKPIDNAATLEDGSNGVQTMTRAGTPGSGATVFEFRGAHFTIQWDDDASEQQTAIQACATVGAGNILVTGTGPFVYTAAGDLAGQTLEKINVVSSTLNQGSQTFAQTTIGGLSKLTWQPIVANHTMYQADAYADIAAGEIAKITRGGLAITNRYEPQVYQDDDNPATYSDAYETDNTNVEIPFTLAQGSVSNALRAAAKARTEKFIRILSTGPVIASAIPYSMKIDMACKVKMAGEYKKDGLVVARDFTAGIRFDETQGFALKIVLVNSTPSY